MVETLLYPPWYARLGFRTTLLGRDRDGHAAGGICVRRHRRLCLPVHTRQRIRNILGSIWYIGRTVYVVTLLSLTLFLLRPMRVVFAVALSAASSTLVVTMVVCVVCCALLALFLLPSSLLFYGCLLVAVGGVIIAAAAAVIVCAVEIVAVLAVLSACAVFTSSPDL